MVKVWRSKLEKNLECYKWAISDAGSSEDQNADRNVDSKGCLRNKDHYESD